MCSLNTVNDEAEVTCSGSVFQMRAPATGKAREPMEVQSNSREDQVVGSRGPESVARRDVSDTDELQQILWYVAGQSTVRQDGNLVGNALRHM